MPNFTQMSRKELKGYKLYELFCDLDRKIPKRLKENKLKILLGSGTLCNETSWVEAEAELEII